LPPSWQRWWWSLHGHLYRAALLCSRRHSSTLSSQLGPDRSQLLPRTQLRRLVWMTSIYRWACLPRSSTSKRRHSNSLSSQLGSDGSHLLARTELRRLVCMTSIYRRPCLPRRGMRLIAGIGWTRNCRSSKSILRDLLSSLISRQRKGTGRLGRL
jgi:hypothetical protein